MCVVADLPLDTYEVVVVESKYFLEGKKMFDMFQEHNQGYHFDCFIGLTSKNLCNFSI